MLPYLLRFISMPAGEGWQFDPGVRDLQGSCQRQKVRPIFIVCITLFVCTGCFHVVVVWGCLLGFSLLTFYTKLGDWIDENLSLQPPLHN